MFAHSRRPIAVLMAVFVFLSARGELRADAPTASGPVKKPAAGSKVKGPSNLGFEEGVLGKTPSHWSAPKVPGFEVQLTDKRPKAGKRCALIQSAGKPAARRFGNLMQQFDAKPFRGKRVRFRAAVRADVAGAANHAHLWLRVDGRPRGGGRVTGFFDNMRNRPITKAKWQYYEIVGDVSKNAERINLGMYLLGTGKVWIDDASFQIVDKKTRVTGRTPTSKRSPTRRRRGTPLAKLGSGLFEVAGSMEVRRRARRGGKASNEATLLLPLPLNYRDQVPLTYELTVEPAAAAGSATIYQDKPHNYVVRLTLKDLDKHKTVAVKFRSAVLVGPSSFDDVPKQAKIPAKWPAEVKPWLASTWCVQSDHERIQAIAKELRADTEDVITIISRVKKRARTIFRSAKGRVRNLTAVEALDKHGSCTSCGNLVAGLLRASGVPARVLSGYPAWSGPLQTHYIVEAYVPGYGWYPIESTLLRSPWPNSSQVNVAVIPAEYESKQRASGRPSAAGGVPYLSLTEIVKGDVYCVGTLPGARYCDHECRLVRRFSGKPNDWAKPITWGKRRWKQWLQSQPKLSGKGRIEFGISADKIKSATPAALMRELQ